MEFVWLHRCYVCIIYALYTQLQVFTLAKLEINFLYYVDKNPCALLKNYLAAFLLFWAIPAPLSLQSAKHGDASFAYCKEFTPA